MSPRAAWRLESLGFEKVYDYVDGKLDWMAAGLATEGTSSGRKRAGEVARGDVPTCGLDEMLGEVRDRVRAGGWDSCVVVNSQRIVLGLLRASEFEAEATAPVQEVMRAGPSTFRPHVPAREMARYMEEHDLVSAPVTTSDGRLVGLLMREDVATIAREGG